MQDFFTNKNEKKEPFKLCFVPKNVPIGKSNIKFGKPSITTSLVTLKFYDRHNEQINPDLINKYLKLLKDKEEFKQELKILTENQRYGKHLINLSDWKVFNFHKKTDTIIKEQLMNYAKIRN